MNAEDVRQYAAAHGVAEEKVMKKGMEAELKEFAEESAEVHTKV